MRFADLSHVVQVGHVVVTRHAGGEERHVIKSDLVATKKLGKAHAKIADKLEAIKVFFRDYKKKKPDDPSPVSFDYDGMYLDAATAVDVIRHHHIHWCAVVEAAITGHRLATLSDNMHGYRTGCDDARDKWAGELEANEALGAATGSTSAVPDGVWLPIEAENSGT
jgi:hypothetical protein